MKRSTLGLRIAGVLLAGAMVIAPAACTSEDDHASAVSDCVETAKGHGTAEPDAQTYCEAAVSKSEATAPAPKAPSDEEAEPEAPSEPESSVVPDVTDLDLQEAQDTLQEAGYRHIKSVDDTGRGRHQVIDSNWIVVDQTPSAGEQKSHAYEIVLFVVKDGEQ